MVIGAKSWRLRRTEKSVARRGRDSTAIRRSTVTWLTSNEPGHRHLPPPHDSNVREPRGRQRPGHPGRRWSAIPASMSGSRRRQESPWHSGRPCKRGEPAWRSRAGTEPSPPRRPCSPEHPTALAVIPGGTLNHFARDHGIPTEVDEALDVAEHGQVETGRRGLRERPSLPQHQLGRRVRAASCETRDRLERYLGYSLASVAAGMRILRSARRMRVTIEVERGDAGLSGSPGLHRRRGAVADATRDRAAGRRAGRPAPGGGPPRPAPDTKARPRVREIGSGTAGRGEAVRPGQRAGATAAAGCADVAGAGGDRRRDQEADGDAARVSD